MSVINQALKDLQKRQQPDTARARSIYQAPQRRGYVLGLGVGAGVLGGMLISYLMITHATAGPALAVASGEPNAQARTQQLNAQHSTANENTQLLQQEAVAVSSDSLVYKATEPTRASSSERAVDDKAAVVTNPERLAEAAEVMTTPTVELAPQAAEPTMASQAPQPRSDDFEQAPVESEEPQGSMRVERVERSADELAEQRLEQAIGAIDGGRGRRGESLLQEALILRPDYTDARQRLAGYYYGRGFSSEALRVLQEGLALSPNNTALIALMARIYDETNRPTEALHMLNRLNVQLPEHSDLLVLRAAMANELGHFSSAAEDYRALLHINPHQGIWWLGLGYAEEQQGDLAAAELAYKQALADERLDRESRNYVRSRMEVLNAW